MCKAVAAIAWLVVSSFLGARSTFAQATTYSENFQSVAIGAGVAGWVDQGVYKTWPDPLDAKNIVYGVRQLRRRAVTASPSAAAPAGTFATYTLQSFSAKGGFEYRGRLLRTNRNAGIDLTFLSCYIVALSVVAIRLSGGSSPTGATDSGFSAQPNRWYDFLIQADDAGGATA